MSTQFFSRYEFKYIFSNELANIVESEVRYFMNYDGFVHPEMGNRYIVRSLYFENELCSNFYEKVDGIKKRSKYRIRTYSRERDNNSPIFLEEKGRLNQRTYKNRTSIEHTELEYFYNISSYSKNLLRENPNNKIIEKFIFDSIRKKIKPTVLIDYSRRPYVNKYGLLFRATFDSNIRSCAANELFPKYQQNIWRECRAGYTILEIKFERSIPPWFHRIIECYNLKRISISKMVLGMEVCGIAYDA
jgi:SPX domain protein involved in polyphosphate accumulation